ncbi:Prophage LambdaBa01, membrane protein [Bacillus thuringiensis serovar kurstaki str. T03a001]|nr:Prophage LambdaBa01, membrane protein [Bacillus thuringiensis serovar kurstaki str. T03a001]
MFESVDLIPFQILLLVLLIMFQTVEMASLMLLNTELAVETIAFHKLDR